MAIDVRFSTARWIIYLTVVILGAFVSMAILKLPLGVGWGIEGAIGGVIAGFIVYFYWYWQDKTK